MTRIEHGGRKSLGAAVALALALCPMGFAQDEEEAVETLQPARIEAISFRAGDPQVLEEEGLLILSFTVHLPEGRTSGFVFDVERSESDEGLLANGELLDPEEDGSYKVETRWPVSSGDCGATVDVVVTIFDEEEATPPATEGASLQVPSSICDNLEFESFE